MDAKEILSTIEELAKKHLDWDGTLDGKGPLRPEMRLVEDLELDSVDMTTLAVEVEDHFDVDLEADEDTDIVTIADLVEAIRRQLEVRDAG